jgi:spermidine synthase
MILRSLLLLLTFFFLPSTALGTISPIMAKFALEQSEKIGNTVGTIYAVSSIGSIVGTFLSGFFLIPLLGITTIIFIVAGLIGILAVLMGTVRIVGVGWIGALVILYLVSGGESFSQSLFPLDVEDVDVLYATDTMYSHLEVKETLHATRKEISLEMDSLVHNLYDPAHPDDLLYEYERVFASLTEYFVRHVISDERFSTLTLGGGGCLFPAYLERRYPASRHEVVEIDPEVVRVARVYFDVTENERLRIITADARNFTDQAVRDNREYDLVFLDAFNSFSIPFHLTTAEFMEDVAHLISPRGLVVVNCIDIFEVGKFLNAFINTMSSVFPHVQAYEDTLRQDSTRSTYVVVGSMDKLEIDVLHDAQHKIIAVRMTDKRLEDLRSRNGSLVLSDNHAPVEKLIGPVYLEHIR